MEGSRASFAFSNGREVDDWAGSGGGTVWGAERPLKNEVRQGQPGGGLVAAGNRDGVALLSPFLAPATHGAKMVPDGQAS